MLLAGDILAGEELLRQVQPGLAPLHVEVETERDGVVLVVNLQHVVELDACGYRRNSSVVTTVLGQVIGRPVGQLILVLDQSCKV